MQIIAMVLISAGMFFFLSTSIGLIRFPDFYCRMHAAGKGDTLSSLLMLCGLALLALNHFSVATLLVSLKIIIISIFIFLASPTATHAIMDAGFESGIKPWKQDNKNQGADDDLAA